ncbi:MAG: PrsW family intramembrane metalloprotease [Actinomycetes bacterium]
MNDGERDPFAVADLTDVLDDERRSRPPGPPPLASAGPWRIRRRRRPGIWAGLGVAMLALVMVGAGMLLLGVLTADTGTVGFLAGLSCALVPVVPVLAALMWLDRYEPEPTGLLVICFGWGATIAALVALIINSSAQAVLLAAQQGSAFTTTATVVAPFVEEAAKGIIILLLARYRRQEFDGVVDGIVLAGVTALGFAFTENILYFGHALLGSDGAPGGLFALGITFLLRGVLGPFAHPFFTACTGVGVGIALTTRHRWLRLVAPVGGYLVAVALHSAWNTVASLGLGGFVQAYALLMVPLFCVAALVAVAARRREGRAILRHLPMYVDAGWLTPREVVTLANLHARRAARSLARHAAGRPGERLVVQYQSAATELAFLRERAARRGPAPDFAQRELQLLAELRSARAALAATPSAAV